MSGKRYINKIVQLSKQTQQISADGCELTVINTDTNPANVVRVNAFPVPPNYGFIAFDGKAGEVDETMYTIVSVNPGNTFVIIKKYL